MTHDHGGVRKSMVWILNQKFAEQVFGCIRMKVVKFSISAPNVIKHFLAISGIEGRMSRQHLIDDAAERPPITLYPVGTISLQNFR